jgi:hypothetical protein
MAARERWLAEKRPERVGEERAMNEDDGLPFACSFVLERQTSKDCAVHGPLRRGGYLVFSEPEASVNEAGQHAPYGAGPASSVAVVPRPRSAAAS